MAGFIFIHRCILDWEWYKDINTKTLFFHCLLKANWEDKSWKGIDISRGSFVTSLESLSNETNLSVKQIRLSLDKLKRTNEVVVSTTNRYTLLSIVKYDDYQVDDNSKGKQRASHKTNKGQQLNNIINNNNNIYIDYDAFLVFFNKTTKKKLRVLSAKAKRQIDDRIKEGYTKEDLVAAIKNCLTDQYHIENPHFLTPEFITRPDKFDKYLNYSKKVSKLPEDWYHRELTEQQFEMLNDSQKREWKLNKERYGLEGGKLKPILKIYENN